MISNKKILKFTQNDRKFQKVAPKIVKNCKSSGKVAKFLISCEKLQTHFFLIPEYNGVANSSSFQTVYQTLKNRRHNAND